MRSTLAACSPSNVINERQFFLALRTYFDGSGDIDDPQHRFITLACCAGEENAWKGFDSEWEGALTGTFPYMHMKEAMGRAQKSPFHHIPNGDIDRVVEKLQKVLIWGGANGLHVFLCSVDLKAYTVWSQTEPWRHLPKPERSCSTWCFYRACDWYSESCIPIAGCIDAFFDRGERYLRHIQSDWQNKRLKRRFPILERIRTVAPVDMRKTPAIQAADMFAWSKNGLLSRSLDERKQGIAEGILSTVSRTSVELDHSQFLRRMGFSTDGFFLVN